MIGLNDELVQIGILVDSFNILDIIFQNEFFILFIILIHRLLFMLVFGCQHIRNGWVFVFIDELVVLVAEQLESKLRQDIWMEHFGDSARIKVIGATILD